MCYRDNVPPLHFDGIHTVSVCGNNGNGKSALIDAITWALWGQTRAKHDDDIIHTGQTETEVEFEFAIGEQTYRILRKHSRPKKRRASGQTILEFQIAANGAFKSITGNTISQTQQKIIDYLHMDYSTFTNSAFLRQGHADEFTTSNPARRKQVLSNILGLSYYDELETQAKELSRKQEAEKEQLESTIKDITEELSQKPAHEAQLIQAQNELSRIENILKEQEYELNRLRKQQESLENKKLQLTQLDEHTAERMRTLEQWNARIQQLHSRIKEHEDLIARRSAIEEGYAHFTESRELNEDLNQKLSLVTRFSEEKHKLEMAILQASQALLKEHALTQDKVGQLETSSQKLPQLKNELQKIQLQLHQLAEEEDALHIKRQHYQELRSHTSSLEAASAQLEKDIEEITEKLRLLLTQEEAICPLCETDLGTEGLKLIEAKYTVDQVRKSDSLKSNQTELTNKKTELQTSETEIAQLEMKLNQDRASVQSKSGQINQEIAQAEEASSQLNEQRKALAEIEERLAGKDFATTQQELLTEIEGELSRLDYDPQQHEQVRHRLSSLEQHEDPMRRLEEADRLINQEKEEASRSEQAVQELHHSLEADNKKKQKLTEELTSLPQLVNDLTRAETEHQTLAAQQKQAQETIGNIKGRLEHLSQLQKRRDEKLSLIHISEPTRPY